MSIVEIIYWIGVIIFRLWKRAEATDDDRNEEEFNDLGLANEVC